MKNEKEKNDRVIVEYPWEANIKWTYFWSQADVDEIAMQPVARCPFGMSGAASAK